MKVLLVFINSEYRPMVPINLTMLEGCLKRRGHDVRVFDASFYKDVLNIETLKTNIDVGSYFGVDYSDIGVKIKEGPVAVDFVKTVSEYKPDLIGFSVYSYFEKIVDSMSKAAKAAFPDIPIIWGGIHSTIAPDATISKPWVDMICIGEGEKALSDLCDKMGSGESIDDAHNIWVKKDGKVIKNSVGPLIDPSELPTPDWGSYPPCNHYGPIDGTRYKLAMVEFSRGCPHLCAYCESGIVKNLYLSSGIRNYVRHKTPKKFIDDCDAIKKAIEILGKRYANRNGGYSRIIKLGARAGDGAKIVQIELV